MADIQKITTEAILNKMAERLKAKIDDLDYLLCSNRQIEKWLQYELVLAMSENFIPVIYDKYDNEIRYDGEQVCDISTEYPMLGLRADVCIAEQPFILKYADEATWQIRDASKIEECIETYLRTKYHYIELKHCNWVGIENTTMITNALVYDLGKYIDLDHRAFRHYSPKSAIAICCASFSDPQSTLKDSQKVESTLEAIKQKILSEARKQYKLDYIFRSKPITDYIYLLMLYFEY